MTYRVVPKFITARIPKSGVRQSPTIERAFLQDEIQKSKTNVLNLKRLYTRQWSKTRPFLSFLGNFRLCRYIPEIDRHNRNIGSDTKKHIFNLSDYSLSDTEKFVLGNGLEFCIPPQTINREELFAEFEILHAQLAKHEISNPLKFNKLRARLSDLAYAYSGSPIDHSDFLLHREHFKALKSLRANNDSLEW